jgi:hypothetical protein
VRSVRLLSASTCLSITAADCLRLREFSVVSLFKVQHPLAHHLIHGLVVLVILHRPRLTEAQLGERGETTHRLSVHRALCTARWQAVSRGGLPQVRSRRYGLLQGAWRRQALSRGGLPQGSCWRRHTPLQRARWRQAVPAGGLLQGSSSSTRQCVLQAVSTARAAQRCTGGHTVTTA